MIEKQWDILGVGSAAVDDLLFLERFPVADEKIPVQHKQRRCGGQTATALVAAARQGAKTAFCSTFGEDDLSAVLHNALEQEGVDCSLAIHDPRCLSIHSIILVEPASASRTILYHSAGFREPAAEDIVPEWIQQSRVVFIDQNVPISGLQAAKLARQYNVPVAADLEFKHARHTDEILELIDHLIVGIDFARQTTGKTDIRDMLRALARPGQEACVITCGEKGCWYAVRGGEPVYFPAFRVRPVDTTGCGDVFHGVYAARIARGETVPHAVEAASAAAALKAAHPGGWAGIPDLRAVENLLKGRK
jgi:sulfofructose kinase